LRSGGSISLLGLPHFAQIRWFIGIAIAPECLILFPARNENRVKKRPGHGSAITNSRYTQDDTRKAITRRTKAANTGLTGGWLAVVRLLAELLDDRALQWRCDGLNERLV